MIHSFINRNFILFISRMSASRKIAIFLGSLALLFSLIEAGPLSFSISRAYRNGREIRAPFKNPEIMVARGFGKRDVAIGRTATNGIDGDREKNELMLDDQENGRYATLNILLFIFHNFLKTFSFL